MKNITLFIFTIPFLLAANSYNVPAGTKDNKIFLNVNNRSGKNINVIHVNTQYNHDALNVYNDNNAEWVKPLNNRVLQYNFDIKAAAKIDSVYTIVFEIYSDNDLLAEKQIDIHINAPEKFEVLNNYPNPFNPVTTISYRLPIKSSVKIDIYNVSGQKIETLLDKSLEAGVHDIEWNAANMSSGVYFYRIKINNEKGMQTAVKRMMLIK